MDGVLVVLLISLFVGAFVSGLAGFAMGVIVASVWMHFLPPVQCAALVVAFGLITQGYGVWKLRRAFRWRSVAPFIAGGLAGVPLGVFIITHANPAHMRLGVGVLVVLYATYGLARPAIRIALADTATDVAAGAVNGLVAGMAGLVGIVITIWCQLRGGEKDAQRMIFQPVMLATSLMSIGAFGTAGAISAETVKLFLLGVPVAFAGTWLGLRAYGRVNEAGFRQVVLWLLLLSGSSLVVSALAR